MPDPTDQPAGERPTHREVLDSTIATEATMRAQSVPVNMYAAGEAVVIVAPVSAVTAADVVVKLRPGYVRFTANLRSAPPREYLLHEWEYGGYDRRVDLPDGYGSDIDASLHNGQLVIRVIEGAYSAPVDVTPTS